MNMTNKRLRLILGISGIATFVCLWVALIPQGKIIGVTEDNAENHIRRLETMMTTYNITYGTECPPSMAAMGPPPPGEAPNARHAGLIDANAAVGVRNGYKFQFSCNPSPWGFTITADPVDHTVYKDHFFVDQTFIMRKETGRPATVYSYPASRNDWPDTPKGLMYWLQGEVFHYNLAYNRRPLTLAELGPPPQGEKPSEKAANLIDAELASGQRLGYRFHYALKRDCGYEVHADPIDTFEIIWFLDKPHYWIGCDGFGYLHREAHHQASADSPITHLH